jgi:type VI secretion system protein ImpL
MGRSPEQLTEAERRDLRREERRNRPRRSLLKDTADVDLQAARLEHLCRLIVRDRWPFCPANGLLMLVPYAAADSEQLALDTVDICQRDLTVMRRALKVHCPLFAMVCDMETAPGFAEFLERFTKEERQQRMGQRCPLLPSLRKSQATAQLTPGADDSYGSMLDTISRWICQSLVPGWVFKKFRLEAPGKATPEEASRGNARLFLLLDDLRERQQRLSTILTRGLDTGPASPWLFGGCYLGATGAEATQEQAFVAGVFHRMSQEQNWVSWTPEALAEEDTYQRWVSRGTIALGVLGIAVVGLGAYLLFGPGDNKPSH